MRKCDAAFVHRLSLTRFLTEAEQTFLSQYICRAAGILSDWTPKFFFKGLIFSLFLFPLVINLFLFC